jgi:hypothetical protein
MSREGHAAHTANNRNMTRREQYGMTGEGAYLDDTVFAKRVKRIERHGSRRRVILKYQLRKLVGKVKTELIWLWIGSSSGLL